METVLYKPEPFNRVTLKGHGKLRIVQSAERQLIVRAGPEIIGKVRVKVSDGHLVLGLRDSVVVPLHLWRHQVMFELAISDLQGIALMGSGSVEATGLDADQITLKLAGSGMISIDNLTADKVRLELTGSGQLKLAGDVESQNIVVNGSGRYVAENLMSDFASVRLNGSGSVALCAADHLDVFIGGSGTVSYLGFPEISKRIFGSGSLSRVRKTRQAAVSE
jgi:cytoskeletal protein CcmA (bactofilin family)